MSAAPRVSVVMPAFNCAGYIVEAMASVAAQTFRDLELIVVDDGSTDGTADAVSAFIAGHPELPVKFIRRKNGGAAAARNAGIAAADGEFIAFLDCDDLWLPHKLEAQLKAIDGNAGAGLVFGDSVTLNEDIPGEKASGKYGLAGLKLGLPRLFAGNYLSTLTVMVRASCLENTGLFDENLAIVEDYDLWLRLAGSFSIVYVDSVVAKYRVHAGNMSRITDSNEEKLLLDLIKVRARALERNPELSTEVSRGDMERCYHRLFLNLATFRLRHGDAAGARDSLSKYLELNRSSLLPYLLYAATCLPTSLISFLWRLRGASKR